MTLPLDPELRPWVSMLPTLDVGDPAAARAISAEMGAAGPPLTLPDGVGMEERTVPGPDGAPEVPVRIFTPAGVDGARAALLYAHGGGFVLGPSPGDSGMCATIAAEAGCTVVSVDYRLAPEHPFPAGADDCFAVLEWLAADAAALGVDPERIGVAGMSAGGGLAAATALRARDRGGPHVAVQVLDIPELDDRLATPSMQEFTDTPMWDRRNGERSWRAYLGAAAGGPVSPYAAPARAETLAGLPPAYVAVCDLDPLRDEGLEYAHRLVRSGVPTELHLYPGTFHGASGAVPQAAVCRRMNADLIAAVRRGLAAR